MNNERRQADREQVPDEDTEAILRRRRMLIRAGLAAAGVGAAALVVLRLALPCLSPARPRSQPVTQPQTRPAAAPKPD